MKSVVRSFVCGNKNATPGIAWCFPGDANCNNYCNHDHSKPMADAPKSFDTIVMEEKDMWMEVIEILAEHDGATDIYEKLMKKYSIKENI